ncbi:MAG: YhcH/YjgK/YiaL family protein [Eubacteriales bacterium]|nr:YhcH/YjgK/YiaL family protein [Eubacteriales bacterium]
MKKEFIMIFDRLEHAKQYYRLGEGIERILRFYEQYQDDGGDLPARLTLDGEKVFLIGLNYIGGQEDGNELEAHREYVDVMYVVEGEEMFYHKPLADVQQITAAYDAADDCTMMAIDPDAARVHFPAGHIAIFFPQDAHLAAQCWSAPCRVRKWIAKVRLDTL